YVIYTSGSTGRPKGVAVPQRAVARLALDTDYVAPGPGRRVGQVANASFDATTFEVWTALLTGGTVVGVDREASLDAATFGRLLAAHRIDSMFLTSSLFNQVARAEPRALSHLDELLVGGEALDPRRVREVLAGAPPRRLLNGYGPTESTTFAVWKRIESVPREAVSVPIGRPLAHTRAWVLDGELRPVPAGVTGELWLGGDGLAWGYLGRPARTAAAFRPDPVSGTPGGRLYATGDRSRWLADGEIDFLGRLDAQVKVRGFRIEPGEVEVELEEHPAVAEAVVLACEDGPGERRLVAYVVPAASASADPLAGLAGWLADRLPAYMVPSGFVALDSLPLTPNGKLDREALAAIEPARSAPAGEGRAETPTEAILAGLWGELLRARAVMPDDDFFDLGGHSLLAMRLVSRLRATFDVELGPAEIFDHPTLAGLAARIDALSREEAGLEVPPLERQPRPEEVPLSFSQERLWFLQQLDPVSSAAFNVRFDMRLDGPLAAAAFAQAVGEVVRRHESLRTRFEAVAGRPVQRVEPTAEVPFPVVDLGGLAEMDRGRELAALARRRARRGFDLTTLPLLSLTLVRLARGEHAVLAAMHHIVSDDWSRAVLAREVGALYAALGEGRPSPLPELVFQYADFALWQRGWLRGEALEAELDFWRERFAGAPEGIELPLDRPRPPVRSLSGG
ncbi:MAG TPA: condensation domain-containing protein, partial [Thermoanaerobaculia bacterium]|nr:condensation domain-containing protein [Thermoanaerobaculia bacterium]